MSGYIPPAPPPDDEVTSEGDRYMRATIAIRETARRMARESGCAHLAGFAVFVSYLNRAENLQKSNGVSRRNILVLSLSRETLVFYARALAEHGFPKEAFLTAVALIMGGLDDRQSS